MATGGMATVFLAQRDGQEGPSSYVIIKAIHRQLSSDQSFRAMFLDEARLTQRIHHPNVVTAGELGEHHGVLYLVMELVHGVSLRQLLEALAMEHRRLLPEVAVYLAVRAAEGLHAAHSLAGQDGAPLGVVHRDVTPDNLLIGFDGIVRIIDFGVAKARDRIAPTSMGVLKGKFGYMAPEQARGNPVDARTDVFALATVLWEVLAAKRAAVVTSDAAALEWARNPHFEPASTVLPGTPPALDAVLARALSVDPAGRPASMLDFASELLAACPGATQGTTNHVATLLSTIITPRVEETRLAMPPDVADVLNGSRFQENPNMVEQLTLKLPDGYVSDFSASAVGPTEVARASMISAPSQPQKSAVAIAPVVKVQG
jgi:serine/threonine protein kinase